VPKTATEWNLRELWWALPRLGYAGNGRAYGVLSIWIAVDRLLESRWQLRPVRLGGVFRYRVTRYHGPTVSLIGGTIIRRNDLILELHFDNRQLLAESGRRDWNPWATMEAMALDLAVLAKLVAGGAFGPIAALHGTTLFAVPGRRLGFEVRPVPHTVGWALERYFLIGLLPIYHRDGWTAFDRFRRDRWPAELWMSMATLRSRYLPAKP
jgi:hypothetical protein